MEKPGTVGDEIRGTMAYTKSVELSYSGILSSSQGEEVS
jgi:hypothetical protein